MEDEYLELTRAQHRALLPCNIMLNLSFLMAIDWRLVHLTFKLSDWWIYIIIQVIFWARESIEINLNVDKYLKGTFQRAEKYYICFSKHFQCTIKTWFLPLGVDVKYADILYGTLVPSESEVITYFLTCYAKISDPTSVFLRSEIQFFTETIYYSI